MNIVIHDGCNPPFLCDPLRPGEQEWFNVTWTILGDAETIVSSSWTVPTGMSLVLEEVDIDYTLDGVVYPNTNRALIINTLTEGQYYITNEIVTSESQTLKKSFVVTVKQYLS